MPKKFIPLCLFFLLLNFGPWSCRETAPDLEAALAGITAQDLMKDVEVISSDEFEGRFPASRGEELTLEYMEKRFREVGAEPGNGDSYLQEVPMVEITNDPEATLIISGGPKPMSFPYGDDFIGWTLRAREQVEVENSPMVFVGYGITAPEYDWDDYDGVDVKGKTVIVLVNDPGFATLDDDLFRGKAMTYYGRWTYKYEEAARRGAAAVLLVHETAPAAYGWGVVRNSWTGPRMSLQAEDDNDSRCAVESWISRDAARAVFADADLDYEEMKAAALERDFKAVDLGRTASVAIRNSIRRTVSHNVVARISGGDRADEFVIYTAHWDHFGKDPGLEGDQIYNGALDNATGTAALIELAEAFKALGPPPGRSILFMAVTGEEQGLLGSDYYATHPIYPLTKTAAVINMDALNILGRMKDVRVVGYGQSVLDDYVTAAAAEQDRVVLPNPTPEHGSYYRSDHFSFAKQGVPAVYAASGVQHREKGEEWGRKQQEEYLRLHYHKPSDNFDPDWDMSGAIEDVRMYFRIGFRLSMESAFPEWSEGSEFKARREAAMSGEKKLPL